MSTDQLTNKIVTDSSQLSSRLANLPHPIVFTNGVFDVLHKGHVDYLHKARQIGESLVLGLNSDVSVRMLGKGMERPLNAEMDRAFVLAGLSSVSLIVLFDEKTPEQLIARIRPEIYVKGGDYDMERLSETALVRSWGGRSLALPFVEGYSTSKLVEKIRKPTGVSD